MLRPQRFEREVDPGPVQIQARKVHFDVSDIGLHWIPGHPVASNVVSLLNVVLPAAERWFVAVQRSPAAGEGPASGRRHARVHRPGGHARRCSRAGAARVHGGQRHRPQADPRSDRVLFEKMLAPSTTTDPKRRLNHLCDRLWLIAAIEHYTAVMGDFALNCAWDDHGASPTMVDLFRWHGSEEVEHRMVAHDVAVYFHDSYVDRIRAMTMAVAMIFVFFQRAAWYLVKTDPNTDIGWWKFNRLRMRLEEGAPPAVPKAVWLQHP